MRGRYRETLICPNCRESLDDVTRSDSLQFSLSNLFPKGLLHSASGTFWRDFNSMCGYCNFPLKFNSNFRKGVFSFKYFYDYLLARNSQEYWVEWKSKQLNSLIAGIVDPSSTYSTFTNPFAIEFGKFIELEGSIGKKKILDIGVGHLELPVYLKSARGRKNLYGLDIFPSKFKGNFVLGIAEYLPFANSFFDVVVISSSIDHFFDWRKSLSEVRRVLKKGGSLYIWSHLNEDEIQYEGVRTNLGWFRVWDSGLCLRLDNKFADPFHSQEALKENFKDVLNLELIKLGLSKSRSSENNQFTKWIL